MACAILKLMTPRTVPEALQLIFDRYNSEIAFVDRQAFRKQNWTYAQLSQQIEAMVGLLVQRGVSPGETVAICAPNSSWWVTVYLACAAFGVIVVPLDFNSTAEFIDMVLQQTKVKLLFKSVYKTYDGSIETIPMEDMAHIVSSVPHIPISLPTVSSSTVLEIVFTSGSTGTPKGVVLTHGNVMSNVNNFLAAWPKDSRHQTNLSLVPLSHMLEQTAGFWAPFTLGYTIVYIASLRPTAIVAALREESIDNLITVPAFLQLLRRRIQSQLDSTTLAATASRALVRAAAHTPSRVARMATAPIRGRLGSRLRTLAVGGAALPADVEDFWVHLGYDVIQGYGLTETSPLATYSNRSFRRSRSVGKGLPNQEISLNGAGELLLRGPHVSKGYYQNQSATDAVLDSDGWFHTGDIAEIDSDGYVFLKGRLKNMLIGSNGLNIYPEDIEAHILNFSEVRDVVVLMDNRHDEPKLTAVVLTDHDIAAIRSVIQSVNQTLASHQTIQHQIIWPDTDFPRTPTRKIRRQLVQDAVDNQQTDTPFIPTTDSNILHGVLSQVSGTSVPITDEMVLAADLAIDSIKRLELVTIIEEKLLVAIEETMITQTTTVAELNQIVEQARKNTIGRGHRTARRLTRNTLLLVIQSIAQAGLLTTLNRYQKIDAIKPLDMSEPALYIANHTSHLDAPTFLRLAGFRGRQRLVIAAAADYFFSTWWKSWLSRNIMHALPVERDGAIRQSLEQIGAEISLGRSVVIFPEGSRSTDGSLQAFKPGIGLLAATLQVPVIPVRIDGNFAILPKGARKIHCGNVGVTVGQPMYFSVTQSPEAIAQELARAVAEL